MTKAILVMSKRQNFQSHQLMLRANMAVYLLLFISLLNSAVIAVNINIGNQNCIHVLHHTQVPSVHALTPL